MSLVEDKSKYKILIVEDDNHLLWGIRDLLELDNYNVIGTAENGEAALDFLHKLDELPDLILSDIMMPCMDGLEFLEAVKQEPTFMHIPFIFLTARGEFSDILRGIRLGANDYVVKPFEPQWLINSIRSVLAFAQDKQDISNDLLTVSRANTLKNLKLVFWIGDSNLTSEVVDFAKLFSKYPDIYPSLTVGDEFRDGIARYFPTVILIYEPTKVLVTLIREFCLSTTIPIIGIFSKRITSDDMHEFYDLGMDEVCVKSNETEIESIVRAVEQYRYPALVEIGEIWNVVIICKNDDMAHDIQQDLTSLFYASITIINSIEPVINISQNLDLILIDEAVVEDILSTIQDIREAGIETPILLMVTDITEEVDRAQYRLGIRGFIRKPVIQQHVVTQIKRLLRWGRQARSLAECWSDYRITVSEKEFRHTLITSNMKLASGYAEIGARHSGLLHDLRNALGLLEGRLRRLDGAQQLKAIVHFANQLMEIIAEARFKGAWRASELDSEEVIATLTKAVENLSLARPTCNINLKLSDPLPKLIGDAKQLEGALTAILLVIAKSCKYLDISVVPEEKHLSIQISGSNTFSELPINLEQAVQANETHNLYLLSSIKVFSRHSASITFDNETLSICLPTGSWADDLAVRLDIARFADDADDLNKKLAKLAPLPQSDSIAHFVSDPIRELMAWCDKIVKLSQSHDERLVKTARYTLLLVRDMLYTSTGYSLPLQAVNLKTVVNTFVDLRGDRLGSTTLSIDIDDLPFINAEELGLLQILINLTTNATEAMGGRGELTIRAKPVRDYVRLEVQDTGSGIPQAELPKLFDLFYSTKQGHERGVGLHIVKSLIEQFNGEITVSSTEGVGTVFSIMLPVALPE